MTPFTAAPEKLLLSLALLESVVANGCFRYLSPATATLHAAPAHTVALVVITAAFSLAFLGPASRRAGKTFPIQ